MAHNENDIPRLPRGDLKCRFGCDTPEAIYSVPAGCICWVDPIQALCKQHEYSVESEGQITMIAKLTPELLWEK